MGPEKTARNNREGLKIQSQNKGYTWAILQHELFPTIHEPLTEVISESSTDMKKIFSSLVVTFEAAQKKLEETVSFGIVVVSMTSCFSSLVSGTSNDRLRLLFQPNFSMIFRTIKQNS